MRRRAGGLSILMIGAAVVASLAFGARVAFAAPALMDCPNDGWNTLGACVDNADCTSNCVFVHGDQAIGHCYNGCCSCLW